MLICEGCGKRIRFWQRMVRHTIHFEKREVTFYTHLNDGCVTLSNERSRKNEEIVQEVYNCLMAGEKITTEEEFEKRFTECMLKNL